MKKWKIGIAVGILSFLMCMAQDMLMAREGFADVRATKADGWWWVCEEERVPRDEADALIAADGQLFLYYEDQALVNVYSTGGQFLRGYQIETISNGVGGVGYRDGVLYIDGKSGIYGFRGEELVVSEVLWREDKELHRFVDEPDPVTDGGYTYYYNATAGRIDRNRPGEPLETVVQLPVKDPIVESLLYGNLLLWAGFAAWWRITESGADSWFETFREGRRQKLR